MIVGVGSAIALGAGNLDRSYPTASWPGAELRQADPGAAHLVEGTAEIADRTVPDRQRHKQKAGIWEVPQERRKSAVDLGLPH